MTIRLISLLIPLAVLGCATKSDGGGGNTGADDNDIRAFRQRIIKLQG